MAKKDNGKKVENTKKKLKAEKRQEGDQEVHEPEIVLPQQALARMDDGFPSMMFLIPVKDTVLFPGLVMPLAMNEERDLATLEQVRSHSNKVGLVAVRPEKEDDSLVILKRKEPDNLYDIGCAGSVVQTVKLPDDRTGVMIAGKRRMRIKKWVRLEPVIIAEVDYPDETVKDVRETEALDKQVRAAFKELVEKRPDLQDSILQILPNVEGPARLTDFVAGHLPIDLSAKQGLLATFEIDARLRQVLGFLEKELDLARLGERVRNEIREKVEKNQRDFYLREQLKALRRELGEEKDEKQVEEEEYRKKIEEAGMSEEAQKRAEYELKRLSVLPQEAAEYHVIRTYLDWLVELPWSRSTEDNEDINRAEAILEEDHYGLEEVKKRIVEFLAVRKLKPKQQGAILCLVGPPGVGKTSLGQSVARAMGREFHRMSLGGMRDEAEIRGHRRTYVGALPGRILQGLKRVGSRNPVFMLDEIDKLASDYRGDPASALLEVLDPAQNHTFADHYLELPFDLSHVLFIATANYAGRIPKPLYDRMEILTIPGYIPDEKVAIARRYLVPRQVEEHGLNKSNVKFYKKALTRIVRSYTREAGVRELERRIGRISRKIAADKVRGKTKEEKKIKITPDNLEDYLGPHRFKDDIQVRAKRPGVATGLAWTPFGGDVLFVEAVAMAGNGRVQVTGKLGDVMSESAQIAMSVVRSRAKDLGIEEGFFKEHNLHIHVPAGAVAKDGPSAGVTLATTLVSLLANGGKGVPTKARVAMTGELTLQGTVLPVGGIREKVVAAKRAGVRKVIVPKENEPDVDELPQRVRKGLEFVFAQTVDDVWQATLPVRFTRELESD